MRRYVLAIEMKNWQYTQATLAKKAGCSQSMISHIINCRKSPSKALKQRLVAIIGIPARELFIKGEGEEAEECVLTIIL